VNIKLKEDSKLDILKMSEDDKGLLEYVGFVLFTSFIFIIFMPFLYDILDEEESHRVHDS